MEWYFRTRPFERSGRVYESLGVDRFKRWVLWLGGKVGRRKDRPNNYFLWDRSPAGLRAFERKTRRSELVHLLAMVAPTASIVGMIRHGTGSTSMFLLMVLIFAINVYPLLLQRFTRARIRALLERAAARADR